MDKRVIFEQVKAIRSQAKDAGIADYQSQAKSPDSMRSYDRIWKRAVDHGEWLDDVSSASFHAHKAALKARMSDEYRRLMKMQDIGMKTGQIEAAQHALTKASELVNRWSEILQTKRPMQRSRSRSKRQKVPKARDWQLDAYEACRTDTERAAVAIMWAMGARPVEIEKGISITSTDQGIELTVLGGKVSKATRAGQPTRTVVISRYTSVGQILDELDGQTVTIDRRKLENALVKIGRKAGLKGRLSGYTFRHQATSDSKAAGDVERTAQMLGHASARSQQRYGHPNQAKGGSVIKAKAPEPVRRLNEPRGFSPGPKASGPSNGI